MHSMEKTQLTMVRGDRARPLPGSFVDQRMRRNAKWLFTLDVNRLLAPMRRDCGLDDRGAKPYGGWKNYYYHYVRSMCNLYTAFRGVDEEIAQEARARALDIARGMLECQRRTAETCPEGMLCPEMERDFVNRTQFVRDSVYSHTHIDAILYVIHKVMIGFLMTYQTFGMAEALEGAEKMAMRVHDAMAKMDRAACEKMTDSRRVEDFFSEAGGVMDGFLLLYRETGKAEYLQTAGALRRSWFDGMFLWDEDLLAWGMEHANSEIPYVEALVDFYRVAGDEDALRAAESFMRHSADHELPQGSVSGRSAFPDYQSELYNYPRRVFLHIMDTPARRVSSGESCCAHNLNRVCKKLLELGYDGALMDAWERRYVNAVLGQQNPETGMFIYNMNLKNNSYKMWGYPDKSFWCCYGTGAEVFSSLTEGAFFEDARRAVACLYMPCEYVHSATGISITESTDYPDSGEVAFEFGGEGELTLALHIPGWLRRSAEIVLPDGQKVCPETRGGLYEIHRHWRKGDVVRLHLPFDLQLNCMPDREEYVSLTCGPNLLVACTSGEARFMGSADELLGKLEPTGAPCTFAAELEGGCGGGTFMFKPVRTVCDETYSGYVLLNQPPVERVTDVLRLCDADSEAAHGLHGVGMERAQVRNQPALRTTLTFFSDPGEVEFEMASLPDAEMQLKLYLDGSDRLYVHQFSGHIVNPLFDLQVRVGGEWKTFCTKSMEADYPNETVYENFVIPRKWTEGRDRLSLRLKARMFHDIPAVVGTLVDRVELFTVEQTTFESKNTEIDDREGEMRFVPNAQGLY